MISEKKFAEIYTSFWREVIPTGDDYIRKRNLQLERFALPIESTFQPNRRALINELAFRLFCITTKKFDQNNTAKSLTTEIINDLANNTAKYIARFREYSGNIPKMTDGEKKEALILTTRLLSFFNDKGPDLKLICLPEFQGCGVINACEGDIILGSTLYEIKAGDRNFRLVDLKQVLVYCALNYMKKQYELHKISLLNPRLGVFFEESLDNLAIELSGAPMSHLFSDIIEFASQSIGSH